MYLPKIFPRRPIVISKGENEFLWDINGKKYIDCVGGNGVALIGHCHPKVVKEIKRQAEQLLICPTIFYNDIRAKLAEKIAKITPKHLTRSFFSNSGTETVECALKLAMKYQGPEKNEFIAMKGGFHGRTMGSLSATWKRKYKKSFSPLLTTFKHAEFGDIDDIKSLITDKTSAVITEIILGEGGIIIPQQDFHKQLRELCNEKDILLIIDEVQTGLGRTGKLFAFQHYGIEPDILCLAKGTAGGVPIGVTISSDEIFSSMKQGDHYSTFGGNPLACAAALATLNVITEDRLYDRSFDLGKYFLDKLKEILENNRIIRDIRGKGLFVAVETRLRIKKFVLRAIKEGLLLLTSGISTIRMLPPLTISKESLDSVIRILNSILIK
ncbi:MAG: acetylornithine/succinylornithine family transaminase [Candidatus Lokiarchaeota archaeon]|nr:acetylornithine/succinylornithine family transaminase [Candidatus Lokiarchaeota archaeon]